MIRKLLTGALSDMSDTELFAAVYRDHLTGTYNRRAFEVDPPEYVALVDMDSLKYVNDTQGHRKGDEYLQELAKALVKVFGDEAVYRISGDEFAVSMDSGGLRNREALLSLRRELPWFSVGFGTSLPIADSWLRRDKRARERSGNRAARGETPPWVKS